MNFSQIGLLYAAREIITTILEVPSGLLADTYGRKTALISAFLLYILSYLLFYYAKAFGLLCFAMLLLGIGDAFRSGTHKGMIMDYLKINNWSEHKIAYYGNTRSWSQLGSALSALMAGLMVFHTGDYRTIYLLAILPYLLNFINIFTYPSELNLSLVKESQGSPPFIQTLRNVWTTLSKSGVLKIINSAALHSAFLKAVKDYIQPLMLQVALLLPIMTTIDSKNRSGLTIGVLYFFIFLMTAMASRYAGKLAALSIRHIEMKTLLLGLSAGLLCGILFHYELWVLSLILFIVIYLVENARKPILTGRLAEQVPNEILASVLSTQSLYKTFITALLAIVLGVVADVWGVGQSLLFVSLAVILVTLLIETVSRNLVVPKKG